MLYVHETSKRGDPPACVLQTTKLSSQRIARTCLMDGRRPSVGTQNLLMAAPFTHMAFWGYVPGNFSAAWAIKLACAWLVLPYAGVPTKPVCTQNVRLRFLVYQDTRHLSLQHGFGGLRLDGENFSHCCELTFAFVFVKTQHLDFSFPFLRNGNASVICSPNWKNLLCWVHAFSHVRAREAGTPRRFKPSPARRPCMRS